MNISIQQALRTLCALIGLTVATAAGAQSFRFQVGGGLASQYGAARTVGAYELGVGYEYEFDQHWTFVPALRFVGRGWEDPDRDVPDLDEQGNQRLDNEGNPLVSRMNRTTSANYVELPLMVHYYYRLGPSRYVVLGAGPYAALGVAGKVKTRGDGRRQGAEKLYYDDKAFAAGGLRRFDAGLSAFAGYQFASGLTLGIGADFGLVPTTSGGGRHVSGMVKLSYTLGLD